MRATRGYTFIEMVLCLLIILLIAATLLPVFARGRAAARRTACASNLAQLSQALHIYSQDYNGRFPPADDQLAPLMPYVKNFGVFACPNEPPSSLKKWGVGLQDTAKDNEPSWLFSSYQYRGGLANDDLGTIPVSADWDPWHSGGVNIMHLGGYVSWHQKGRALVSGAARPRPTARQAAVPQATQAPADFD